MEACYETLLTIYDIVKSDPSPHTYLCSPQEIILRQTQDWSLTQKDLKTLVIENLISIKQLDKIAITITPAGITKAKKLKDNFATANFFSLRDDRRYR